MFTYQSRVGELVQANNDKLERIEKFLETLGSKIEGFLMADEADNELSMAKKKEANSVWFFSWSFLPNCRGSGLFTVAGVAVGLFGTVVNELAFHQNDSYLIVYIICLLYTSPSPRDA